MKRRWRNLVISKMLEYYLIPIAFTLLYTIVECSFFYRIKDDAFKIYQPLFMAFFSMINVEIYFLSFLIKEIRKEMFKHYYIGCPVLCSNFRVKKKLVLLLTL